MAQKKSTKKRSSNKSISPLYLVLVFILAFAYYHYYGNMDFEEFEQTKYKATTEISDNNSTIINEVSSNLNIYFWYVGQADCTLLSCDGEYMLIDAGNNPDGKLIANQLKKMGISKINYLIGTHPHEDHIGGLDDIIKEFNIGKIFMPSRQANSKTFEEVLDAVSNKNLKISNPKVGTAFNLGEASCKILSAKADAEDTNDSSIVLQVDFGNHKYLFTGDLTSTLEPSINWEDIDVLKVAHHGSRYSSSKDFLTATKPEISIISDGKINDYGHPHKETLNRLKKVNSKIYRTDESGTIHLTSDGKEISLEFLDISLDGNGM